MEKKYSLPKYFINRELSWLEFNERVLEEAKDNNNPLFERLKFASIASSNLDEFFMTRVAALKDMEVAKVEKLDPAGLTPKEQLKKISSRVNKMVSDQYNCYNRSLKQSLRKENIIFLKPDDLDREQKQYIEDYYLKNIYPVLTPMLVDKSRPFPLVLNKTLNLSVLLKEKGKEKKESNVFGTIQIPSVLERFINIPNESSKRTFIFLEDIIKMNINTLFSGHDVLAMGCYRITRNADLGLDEEEAVDLLEAVEESLKQRKWGSAIRLEYINGMDSELLNILKKELELSEKETYEINGPLDLTYLMKLSNLDGFEKLKYEPIKRQNPIAFSENKDMFDVISKGDVLLHHVYESFDPVVTLVKKAAVDPDVLAIKQTLYRVSGHSPIIEALAKAAENGKQVTVLLELKARFDEQNNIHWAKRLEEAGCHVIYGIVGLKTHCKALLIVRREEDGIRRYVHFGTGNYNDVTANIYTDLGLFTSNPYYGADASALFNMLSGHSQPTSMYKTTIAPISLRDKFLNMIKAESENAKQGKKARIIIKVNSIVDKEIIEALYEASASGVKIDLIVRGICCLRPKIPGVSEGITVRSIVGRFLEHSRIYYFYNDGNESIYLSSADLMHRNLNRRVELLFPIEDEKAREKVKNILDISLKDTVKARLLNSDGTYVRIDKRHKDIIESQMYFYNKAVEDNTTLMNLNEDTIFKAVSNFSDEVAVG